MHEILLHKRSSLRVCFVLFFVCFSFFFCVRFASFIDCLQITLRIQIWSLFIRFVILFFSSLSSQFTHIHFVWRYWLSAHGFSAVYVASNCSHIRKSTIKIVKHHWFHIKKCVFFLFFNEQLQIYFIWIRFILVSSNAFVLVCSVCVHS